MKKLVALLSAALVAALSCSSSQVAAPEWLPRSPEAHADFETFALRCSKCHSLARPLNSGIDSDEYWALYVAKMRRQPGSGISRGDEVAILRFLHLYAIEQLRRKGLPVEARSAPLDDVDASTPARSP